MARTPRDWFAFLALRQRLESEGLRCPRCDHHSRAMQALQDAEPPGFRCDACAAMLTPDELNLPEDPFEYEDGAIVLYRPIGQAEHDLLAKTNWTRFPPRLSWQPIFYPVLNQGYAEEIAARWNTEDEGSGHVGYVTRFRVKAETARRYEVKVVGRAEHQELWVPSEELEAFNEAILGTIAVVGEFRP